MVCDSAGRERMKAHMARKNRVSVPNGTYHITTRIVNRERWLDDPELKDEIVSWIYGIAAFSGVELLAWAVLDNHFHLVIHVPNPPESTWNDPDEVPEAYALGMRPPECRAQLWSSSQEKGDSPCAERPATAFMLTDEEMLARLEHLYGNPHRVNAIRKSWAAMRRNGNGSAVDAVKERYCRRMYNVSQFVKTLKERIAQVVNSRTGHVGHVFEGRFYSGLMEDDGAIRRLVTLYVDYNPCKAGLVHAEENYRWSSFGQARGNGLYAASCRAAYEQVYGCSWDRACAQIEEAFRDRIADARTLKRQLDEGRTTVRPSQLVHLKVDALSRGAFIGRSIRFGQKIEKSMPENFPHPSFRGLFWLHQVVQWTKKRSVA